MEDLYAIWAYAPAEGLTRLDGATFSKEEVKQEHWLAFSEQIIIDSDVIITQKNKGKEWGFNVVSKSEFSEADIWRSEIFLEAIKEHLNK